MIRFIHTSDLHLDTPFKGLSAWNNELASKLKDATLRSFRRIIDLCIRERVDFLVVAGDIFDSESRSLAAQLTFVSELKRLSDQGIATYLVCGNHDPLNSWLDTLEMPPLVHRFGGTEVEVRSHEKEGKAVADIYGISFLQKEVSENLAARYRRKPDPAPVSVAVMHGTVGAPGPHHSYAPFKADDIRGMGFDYWALGHIHKHTVVQPANPAVVYPGNPQGRDFGETGVRGCCLVEIEAGQPPAIGFVPTHHIRFEEVRVDLSAITSAGELPDAVMQTVDAARVRPGSGEGPVGETGMVVRLELDGRTPLHALLNKPGETEQLLQHFNQDLFSTERFIWFDRIGLNTLPDLDLDQIRDAGDFTAGLLQALDEALADQEALAQLIGEAEAGFASAEARRELDALSDKEKLAVMGKAKWLLLDKLLQE